MGREPKKPLALDQYRPTVAKTSSFTMKILPRRVQAQTCLVASVRDHAEEVKNILTNRLKNALLTDEIINAPNWVSDLAAYLALAVTMVEKQDRPGLQAFANRELDPFLARGKPL
jgi:hypothetical protein